MALIDPDCRDNKHASCVGGPCECQCHTHEEPCRVHQIRWCTICWVSDV